MNNNNNNLNYNNMKTKFNKRILWMLAAILICGAMVLTSCSNDDDTPVVRRDIPPLFVTWR